MKKELSKEMQDAMKNVPPGQVAMPFLTPTDKEFFKEQVMGENKYKIYLDESYFLVQLNSANSFSIIDNCTESDWHLAKLHGYIIIKLLAKYK